MHTQFYAHFKWNSRYKATNIQNINEIKRRRGRTWINPILKKKFRYIILVEKRTIITFKILDDKKLK